MSRKKKHEHVNHERWLVSYADFITLLFAFFVVLFASGQSDKHKKEKMAAAMQSAFTEMGIFEQHATKPSVDNVGGLGQQPTVISAVAPAAAPKPVQEQVEALRVQLAKAAGGAPGQKPEAAGFSAVSVHASADGIVISLHEGGIFDSGSAALRPQALPVLRAIAATLPQGPVRVEGHTDNVPIRSALYASNWELSTARAAAIARFLLEETRLNPADVAVAGYAEFHPAADNATAEGRAANRRVDLVLVGAKR